MLINDEWRKCNPINGILEPDENLLWIGRPDQEIYVRGEWNQRGVFKYRALSALFFFVATIGLFASNSAIPALFFTVIVSAIPLTAHMLLGSKDYNRASWYSFSEKRIFLAAYDDEDFEFRIYQTELSNLKDILARKSKRASEGSREIGTLVCTLHREIPKHVSKKLVFDLIDNPSEVQKLLLDTEAASEV